MEELKKCTICALSFGSTEISNEYDGRSNLLISYIFNSKSATYSAMLPPLQLPRFRQVFTHQLYYMGMGE